MANQIYTILIEEMARILKISKRELESDIKEISEYWETCLEKADVMDRDTAIFILTTCVNCYLRGRGVRLGSYPVLKKNNGVLASFVTLVPLYTWRQSADYYPKVHKLIPREIYYLETTPKGEDVLAQAQKILEEKWER
jgi:hypothetical protein